MTSQFSLLREQRFRPFFFSQLLGAFNDNVFKTVLITLLVFHGLKTSDADYRILATALPAIFILPFLICSATAGQLADKFEKSMLMRRIKLFEIAIMLLASLGFYLDHLTLLTTALFLMGVHSSLFGPVKYAYLPQHLSQEELIGGNAMVETATFLAILLGQIIGVALALHTQHALLASLVTIGIALAGYWASLSIPNSPAGASDLKLNWHPIQATWENLKWAKQNKKTGLALLAISWFWFYGATLLAQFPAFAKDSLGADQTVFILLLAIFSCGIGLGSLLCEKLSKRKIQLGLVVFGALGIALFGIDLYLSSHQYARPDSASLNYLQFLAKLSNLRLLLDIALIGLFGGFYVVPLYAYLQAKVDKSHQARIIASNNILNALFMVLSGLLSIGLFKLGLSIAALFLVTALLHSLLFVGLCLHQPHAIQALLRWLGSWFARR
ncbi:MAG: MFS transporter [Methylotenera sp.]|nr:MFS transporter [Methylotenera sp.]